MIQHVSYVFTDLDSLTTEIKTGATSQSAEGSHAQLVQIYCAEANREQISAITTVIVSKFPAAVVVGATSIGEVVDGRLMTKQTVIGFTFFESSTVNLIAMASVGDDEQGIGAEIGRQVNQNFSNIAGIMVLATTISIDASLMLAGLESTLGGFPIFGGGAADYLAMSTSLVFSTTEQFDKGVVVVVFSGSDLHIECNSYLGWQPLSQSMRITQVDGLHVQQVDGQPAFTVYQRYLNLPNDDQFSFNAIEFPFLLERDGRLLARVPIAASKDGSLQFVSDIKEGESFRIGYGDIDSIIENSKQLHESMAEFCPQAIFLYSCSCRRLLMQESVELETLPLEGIAPTFGFYTFGEFFGSSRLSLLNSGLVAVGLREGPKHKKQTCKGVSGAAKSKSSTMRDPLGDQHSRVVSRLMRFIKVVLAELEASIQSATRLSMTDQLTQLANRLQLDQMLDQQVKRANRYRALFSIILLDLDYFKYVNDTHGHLMGDKVLMQVANALMTNTRGADIVGRWGGEEFLIITPDTATSNAGLFAEKLRRALESIELPFDGCITASFGVTGFLHGDDSETLVARADAALYAAKNAGRNQVVIDHVAQ